MVSSALFFCVSALLLAAFFVPGSHADAPDCTNEFLELQPCLSYVNGQVSAPSSDCCKGLSSVHVNRPVCLCMIMNNTPNVNGSTATMLPAICKVNTDPSRCPALLKGEGAAAPTAGGSGGSSSSTPSTPANNKGKSASAEAKDSASVSTLASQTFVVAMAVVASFAIFL